MALQGESRQLQASNPACGAPFRHLAPGTQAGQRERGILTGSQDHMQLPWQVLDERGQRLVHRLGLNQVVIVQDQDKRVREGGQVIEEGGEQRFERWWLRGLEHRQDPGSNRRANGLQGSNEVGQKAAGVVVPLVQRQPCGWTRTSCQPLADQGGFTKAGRGRGEREGARQALLESLNKVDTGHQLRPRTGLVQLGCEQGGEQLTVCMSRFWLSQYQRRFGHLSLLGRGETTRLAWCQR